MGSRHFRRITVIVLLVIGGAWASGCSTTMGRYVPSSRLTHPNSKVTVLGRVRAEVSSTAWFISPSLGPVDLKRAYNDALRQAEGANILINFKENTTYTTYGPLPVSTVKYTIEGQAAKMEIPKQKSE